MSDDEWGDLLDNLDTEPPQPPPPLPPNLQGNSKNSRPKSSGLDFLLDSDLDREPQAPKTVNFAANSEEKAPEMRAAGRSTNALSDLFGTSTGSGLGASGAAAPRRPAGASTLDDLFGTAPRAATVTPGITVAAPVASQPTSTAPPPDNFDAGRILRLEAELERVNRELEDTKRKKREDEEDLENFWKTKLEIQAKDSEKTLEDAKNAQRAQISKLQDEHHVELERLKANYDRQLENVTSSTSQVGDLVAVVGKVDTISTNIDKIAADVVASTNKVSSEQSALFHLQEELLKIRETKLSEDMAALKLEQLKVHELNLSLKDLVKNQQDENEREKWRTKEEWNRLKVERQIFKENQDRVIENVQREKLDLAHKLKSYHKDQTELLFRLSSERELLEQEKSEFFAKRDQDIKRIKAEAYELDLKSQQISTADQHVTEMKLVTEAKYRQLQHLETLLTAECSEIERIRNEQKIGGNVDSGRAARRISREEELFGSNNSNQNSHRHRSESVRASLKKHYENLEKYAGQKVAHVAPQNN